MSNGGSRSGNGPTLAKFFHVSRLRGLRGCQQVAAVCYRVRGEDIEFLLVQTRGGRWIFPKGNAEPGLTHAQALRWKLLKKLVCMGGWKKLRSRGTWGAKAIHGVRWSSSFR